MSTCPSTTVVLSGAGVEVECGIDSFRTFGSDGALTNGVNVAKVWADRGEGKKGGLWDWGCIADFAQLSVCALAAQVQEAKPGTVHNALAEVIINKGGYVVTQNISGLLRSVLLKGKRPMTLQQLSNPKEDSAQYVRHMHTRRHMHM